MSVARRPLLTATAAGTLLCALWFVPSANATDEELAAEQRRAVVAQSEQELRLADTGGVDTTPYLLGGTGFLVVGAGFVTLAMRRGGRAY
ncbi:MULTISPECIES: hypothetical protein [Streptomyces]|uniref:Uncharacterized protein n=1 Tax=Streptomyces solicathayae TaxID=3081768 RepID=A0ABZ0LSJ2_9ACTN|nr:hypothetical protein [Streptomyces sp. HUAS YS2]WOX22464.1 hypothetical protein R2D22_14085 [Streptomyces sp. HUAS YS2]